VIHSAYRVYCFSGPGEVECAQPAAQSA